KGIQKFGYALFFMSDDDLAQFRNSSGREIRTGLGGGAAEGGQKPTQQPAASASVSTSADQLTTIGQSPAATVWHASPITHRPAMNDQQEAAPRPNDQMLASTHGGFASMPDAAVLRPPPRTARKGVYVFAFNDTGLILGLSLTGTKMTPIQKTEKR